MSSTNTPAPTPPNAPTASMDMPHYVLCDVDNCPGYHCAHVAKELAELRSQLLAARRGEEATQVALRAAAKDCADDLEAELRNRYHYPDIHPAMQYKYDRDMDPVLAVRAALAAAQEKHVSS